MRVMRNVIHAAVLVAATPAVAQPVTEPKACQVTIARAPDDVRAVVEAWVTSEAQCSVALEVRIVPTDGGLYLLAQDEHGGVRERIVPDAQTAGVLVASWIADDNAPALPPPAPPPIAEPAPVAAPEPLYESISPPGLAPIAIAAHAPSAPSAPRNSKWITAGGLLPMADGAGMGLRIEADVLRRGRFLFGAALSAAGSELSLASSSGGAYLETEDYKVMAYAARPWQRGRWQLRPALGIGAIHSEGYAYDGESMFYETEGTFPTVEASFMVSRELGKSWAAYTGPLATVVVQEFTAWNPFEQYPMTVNRSNLDFVMFAGVRRRL